MKTKLTTSLKQELERTTDYANLVSGRTRPLRLAEREKLPAVVYKMLQQEPDHTHDGYSGFTNAMVRIAIIADKFDTLLELRRDIFDVIDSFKGVIGEGEQSTVGRAYIDDEKDVDADRDKDRPFVREIDVDFDVEE